MYIAHILENFQFNAAYTCIITKIYDKRISSVTENNNNNNSLAFKASDQDVSVVLLFYVTSCVCEIYNCTMNVLLLLAQVMHEVVVVEGNSVSVLLFEGSLFLFFYYITTALLKHAAACSAGKSGYAEVISMIANTCRGRIACAVMNLSRETKTNST
ncbi:hypothetical protein T06_5962 [Trichinella sp. T6]|nr:hypothetical protein T06_5962 [Trichinella sp. T6]